MASPTQRILTEAAIAAYAQAAFGAQVTSSAPAS